MRYDPTEALSFLDKTFRWMGVNEDEYVLFGSMGMYFEGLRDEVGDIDVFVTRRVWDKLQHLPNWIEHKPDPNDPPFLVLDTKPPIHAFYDWTKKSKSMDVARNFAEARTSESGWRYAPLTEVVKWKREAVILGTKAPKHLIDIETIETHLGLAKGLV